MTSWVVQEVVGLGRLSSFLLGSLAHLWAAGRLVGTPQSSHRGLSSSLAGAHSLGALNVQGQQEGKPTKPTCFLRPCLHPAHRCPLVQTKHQGQAQVSGGRTTQEGGGEHAALFAI